MSSLFITGTDTDIGKTYTVALLAKYLSSIGKSVSVFKPIQTGCEVIKGELRSPDLDLVKKISPKTKTKSTYLFELAATPELAAEQTKTEIDFQKIKSDYESLEQETDIVLVEGAGGLLVPVYKGKTIADLIHFVDIPAVIVSSNRLGTINHTCLSCSYAKAKEIDLIGFVFSKLQSDEDITSPEVSESNARFIERYSSTKFLGNIPYLQEDNIEASLHELSLLKAEKWI